MIFSNQRENWGFFFDLPSEPHHLIAGMPTPPWKSNILHILHILHISYLFYRIYFLFLNRQYLLLHKWMFAFHDKYFIFYAEIYADLDLPVLFLIFVFVSVFVFVMHRCADLDLPALFCRILTQCAAVGASSLCTLTWWPLKIIGQYFQIHDVIWTNTFCNFDKYRKLQWHHQQGETIGPKSVCNSSQD